MHRCQLLIQHLANSLGICVAVYVPGRGIENHLYCDHIGQSQLPFLSFLLTSSKVTWHLKTTVSLKREPTSQAPVFTLRQEGCTQTIWIFKIVWFSHLCKIGLLWAWRILVPLLKSKNILCPSVVGKGQDEKWMVWGQPLARICLLTLWGPAQRLFSLWSLSSFLLKLTTPPSCTQGSCLPCNFSRSPGEAGEFLLTYRGKSHINCDPHAQGSSMVCCS